MLVPSHLGTLHPPYFMSHFCPKSKPTTINPKELEKAQVIDMEEEAVRSRFKRVCVFCGSSTGKRECYKDAAIELGQELVLIFLCSFLCLCSVCCVASESFELSEGVKEAGPCLWRWEHWVDGFGFTGCA